MSKGEGCATGVDRFVTTGADVGTSEGEGCEAVVGNWNPDENGKATETKACISCQLDSCQKT